MTILKRTLLLAVTLATFATGGCMTEPTSTDEAPAATDVDRDQTPDVDFAIDQQRSVEGDIDTAATLTCALGAVGDEKYFNNGCCSSRQRQQLYRCDGHHWQPLVGRYRCLAYSCAI